MEIFHFLINEEESLLYICIVCLFLRFVEVELNLYCVMKWVFLIIVWTVLDHSQDSPLLVYYKLLSENIHVCVVVFSLMACLEFCFICIVFYSW